MTLEKEIGTFRKSSIKTDEILKKENIKLFFGICAFSPLLLLVGLLSFIEMGFCVSHYNKERELAVKNGDILL